MVVQTQLFNLFPLPPLIPKDISYNPFALEIPPDVLQLQADALNVVEGRVSITDFDPEYQEKIKNYYRFAAIKQTSRSHNIAQRTINTLEII